LKYSKFGPPLQAAQSRRRRRDPMLHRGFRKADIASFTVKRGLFVVAPQDLYTSCGSLEAVTTLPNFPASLVKYKKGILWRSIFSSVVAVGLSDLL
jgi:hypothetical protein